MSDEKKMKPFVTFEQVGDDPTDCDVLLGGVHISDIADLHDPKEAAELDASVERERREAAVKALREASKDADCYAEETMEHLGHHEGLLADAIRLRVVRWLNARAAKIERGEQ